MDALKGDQPVLRQFASQSPLPAAINYTFKHWGDDHDLSFFHTTSREYSKMREIMIAAILLASTSLGSADGLVDARLTYKEYAAQNPMEISTNCTSDSLLLGI